MNGMLKILRRIMQEIGSAPSFQEALSLTVNRVARALKIEACSIFLLDRSRCDYVFMATKGLNPLALNKVRIPVGQGLIGWVAEREEPLNLEEASKHPQYLQISELHEEKYQAFLGVPVIYHRQVLGILVVQQKKSRRFDDSEEAFLVTLAAQLASVIAHAEATGILEHLFASPQDQSDEATYSGIPSAPGVGIGTGVVIAPIQDLESIPDRQPDNIEDEIHLLEGALAAGREDFRLLSERLYPNLPFEERSLFDVYQRLLDVQDLGKEIIQAIRQGNWAPGALRSVIQSHVARLESLENAYLRERAVDIKALGYRILLYLQKNDKPMISYADHTILIGEQLTAADLADVPVEQLAGVISVKGSSSSHIAILARAMGIPTVMGVSELPVMALQNKPIIVDGYYGQIYVSPRTSLLEEYESLAKEEQSLEESLSAYQNQMAQTHDGKRITLLVNAGLGADGGQSLAIGAEGVGLYRTEMPFMMRDRFPSSEEQRAIYRELLSSFAPMPVAIRTLDIGGDKPLPYFPFQEENPFLGWRGIRVTLDHSEIFLVQVRAMLRASVDIHNLRIMLPMVTDVGEVDEALGLIKRAYHDVRTEGLEIAMPDVGVMIEVPSAVYQARSLAKRVDFLSVGSNDLTQYILAVDRNNSHVANLYDSLHPSVLRALLQVVESGHQEGKHVSICGEMAGDPMAVLLLIAMGFDSLSMSAPSLARIKWVIHQFTMQKAYQLLKEVLAMESTVMIRGHMELALEQAGLGGLLRAGKR